MSQVGKRVVLGLLMAASVGAPAVAQEGYVYGPHDRYQDELARPAELDGLALGRDAPLINGRDADIGTRAGGGFELQAPPIGDTFPAVR